VTCFDVSVDRESVLLSFTVEDMGDELPPLKLAASGPSERCRVELYGLYVETFCGNVVVGGLATLWFFLMSTGAGFETEVVAISDLNVVVIFAVCRGDLKVLKSLLMLMLEVLLTTEDCAVVGGVGLR
jgi:hypothetical protein